MSTDPQGYDPQAGSKYGTGDYVAGSYSEDISEPPQYRKLITFTLISFATYVVAMLTGLLPMLTGEMEDVVRDQLADQGIAAGELDDAMTIMMITSAVTVVLQLVVAIGLYLTVFFGLRAKKNWARILGLVMAFIGLAFTLGGMLFSVGQAFASATFIVSTLLSLVWAGVTVYWLVLAFNGQLANYLAQESTKPPAA